VLFIIVLLLLLVAAGMWEFHRHQRNIDRIPVRVLVNGTRGKSSVTRLITGGLQGGGIRTLGKTTGTKPRVIYPDGHEVPIIRAGKANIIEQLKVFRRAVSLEVQALVTECMAVLPANQIIMQQQLVRSTAGVITNVRADHLDEMGPTMEDVARSLSNTIPDGGVVFTSEHIYLQNLNAVALERDARVIEVSSDGITDEMMKGFTYLEHKDNVALALAVCSHLGVHRSDALDGMYKAVPDPGVLRVFRIHYYERELEFVNAFAANDPDSYIVIWAMLKSFFTDAKKIMVIVNCREDRIQRTESLAELIAGRLRADHFILVGEFTLALYNRSVSFGLPASQISDMGQQSAEEVFQKVVSMMDSSAIVIGIGNIVGFGEELIMHFTNRGKEIVY
jgi:poly-gamma-glutamate synthase PgsB/CapB